MATLLVGFSVDEREGRNVVLTKNTANIIMSCLVRKASGSPNAHCDISFSVRMHYRPFGAIFRGSSVVERLAVKGSFSKEFENEKRGELLETRTRKSWVISSQAFRTIGLKVQRLSLTGVVPRAIEGRSASHPKITKVNKDDDIVHPASNDGQDVTSWS